jgi:hypothetical protein
MSTTNTLAYHPSCQITESTGFIAEALQLSEKNLMQGPYLRLFI